MDFLPPPLSGLIGRGTIGWFLTHPPVSGIIGAGCILEIIVVAYVT